MDYLIRLGVSRPRWGQSGVATHPCGTVYHLILGETNVVWRGLVSNAIEAQHSLRSGKLLTLSEHDDLRLPTETRTKVETLIYGVYLAVAVNSGDWWWAAHARYGAA